MLWGSYIRTSELQKHWKLKSLGLEVEKGNFESKVSKSLLVKTGGVVERQLFINYRNLEEIP